ncbi:MAG: DHCW motif cupin fold protein [Myxococcales bacterium]
MQIKGIPYEAIDLEALAPEQHPGETGTAIWKTAKRGDLRVRIVEYGPGYLADHWCEKGHVVFVLEGSFVSELKDGTKSFLKKGMCYLVSDHAEAHRSSTEEGVRLLIVD